MSGRSNTDRSAITQFAEGKAASDGILLDALLDNVASPIFYKDKQGRYRNCNRQFAREVMGVDKTQIIGRSVLEMPELVPPDLAQLYHERDLELMAEPGVQRYQAEVQFADGSTRLVNFTKSTVLDSDGNVIGVVGIMDDLTEVYAAQLEVRQSEAKYRALVDDSGQGIAVYVNGLMKFCNPQCEVIFGRSFQELVELPVLAAVHPDDRQTVLDIHTRRLQSKSVPRLYLTRILRPDGSVRWIEVAGQRIQWEGQQASLNTFNDVTERIEADEHVRMIAYSLSRVSDLVYWLDDQGKFVFVNDAACERYGYDCDEFLQKHVWQISPESNLSLYRKFLDELKVTRSWMKEITQVTREGLRFPVSITCNYIEFEGRTFVCAFARDITEQVEQAREISNTESRYRQLFNSINDSLVIADKESYRIVEVNDAALRLYGYERDEMIGMHYPDLSNEPESTLRALNYTVSARTISIPLRYHRRKDGTVFPVEISGSAIELDGQTLMCAYTNDITERRKAERELRLAQFSLEHTSQMVLWIAATGTIVDCNQACVDALGYSEEELIGLNIRSLDISVTAERFQQVKDTLESGNSLSFEATYKRKDNSTFPVEVSISQMQFEGESISCAFVHDMTRRERDARRIRESEARFKELFDSVQEGIGQTDLNERIEYCNPSFAEIFEADSPEELIGRSLHDFLDDDGWTKVRAETDVRRLGAQSKYELDITTVKGNQRTVLVSSTPRRDANGRTNGSYGTIVDVTERKHLEMSRALLSAAIESSIDSMIITDRNGIIEYVNAAFEKITGYHRAEVVGHNVSLLKSGEHDGAFYQGFWKKLKSGAIWKGNFRNRRKDGTLYDEAVTIAPVLDKHGEIAHYVSVRRDITHDLMLEKQLQQSQKMEAIGVLAGGIAHDFNNMLTAIIGYANLMVTRSMDDNTMSDLQEILRIAERASSLTRQLLTYSRKKKSERKTTNANDHVVELAGMLKRILGSNHELVLEISEDDIYLEADTVNLEQIIMNLVVNARDAMSDGGQIKLSTEQLHLDSESAMLFGNIQPGEYLLIVCRDEGVGIDDATIAKIFDPFFTTKDVGEGTGLGLSTVYGIIQQYNGGIHVESELGVGTAFSVVLPISAQTSVSDAEDPVADAAQIFDGKVILIVEDDEVIRSLTSRILKRDGYRVLEARNHEEVIEQLRKNKGKINLAIVDVVLEDVNAYELTEEFKAFAPNTDIVYMSGYPDDFIRETGLNPDEITLVRKPFAPETLLMAVFGDSN